MKKTLSLIAMIFFVALAVQAQPSDSTLTSPLPQELKLHAARAGFELDASGVVQFRTLANDSITVAIRANADLPDGSVLVVSLTNQAGLESDIGAIEVRVGSGLLRLNSNNSPESAVFPVENIRRFEVSYRGEILLERDL